MPIRKKIGVPLWDHGFVSSSHPAMRAASSSDIRHLNVYEMFVEFTILHLTIHIVPSMNHAVHQLRTGASSSLAGWSLHGIWF